MSVVWGEGVGSGVRGFFSVGVGVAIDIGVTRDWGIDVGGDDVGKRVGMTVGINEGRDVGVDVSRRDVGRGEWAARAEGWRNGLGSDGRG